MEILFFIKNYTFFIGTLILLYCIGRAFISLFLKEVLQLPKYFQIFTILILGTVISITGFSIWKTNGVTINLVYIVILFFLIRNKEEIKSIITEGEFEPIKRKDLIILFIGSLIIFIYNFFNLNNDQLITDYISYSRISYFINYTGEENEYYISNLLDTDFKGSTPYHFFELWLNAIVTSIFGGQSINNYLLITGSILVNIIFIGYIALWERFQKISYALPLIIFLFLFYGGTLSPFLDKMPLLKDYQYIGFSVLLYNISKFAIVYIFILATLLFTLYDLKILPTLFLLFLPIATFTTVPAVAVGSVLFISISYYLKYYKKNEAIKLLVYLAITIVFIFLFYSLTGNQIISRDTTSIKDISGLLKTFSLNNLKTRFNIVAGAIISSFILYLPLWLSIAFIYNRKYAVSGYGIFSLNMACLFFSGLLGWCFLADVLNSVQVFYFFVKSLNVLFVISAIIIISKLMHAENFKFNIYNSSIILLLILIPIGQIYSKAGAMFGDSQKYSASYLERIKAFIDSSENKMGVFIKDSADYSDIFSKYPTFGVLGDYLSSMDNHAVAVSISDLDVPINQTDSIQKAQEIKAIKMGAFYQFANKEKIAGTFKSMEDSQVNFIKQFRIKYIILSARAKVYPSINSLVNDIYVDEKSGEKFLVLEYN